MGKRRIIGLDALKCLAIILVVIYHCFPGVLAGGFLAVETFFVISGYLIGRKLIRMNRDEKARFGGPGSFFRFLWERLKRFWPVLIFCMIVTLSVAFFADADLLTGARGNSLAAVTFSTNIVSILTGSTYENSLIPNLFNQTWFLAVDLQLCLVCFLIMAGFFRMLPIKKNKARRRYLQLGILSVVLAAISFGLMGVYGGWFGLYTRAYYGPDAHAGAFFLGVAVAGFTLARRMRPAKKNRRWVWATLALLAVGGLVSMTPFVRYESAGAFLWALPVAAVLSALMVVCVLKLQRVRQKKMAWPLAVLEYVGGLSFGIYLLHYGLNILLPDMMDFWPGMAVAFVTIGVSVILSIVLRHLIVPFSQKHKVWFYLLVGMSLILPVMSLVKAPEKSSIELNLAEAAAEKETIKEAEEVTIDYTGVVGLANMLNGSAMKYFDGVEAYAKPYPVVTRAVGGGVNWGGATASAVGRGYYNTPLGDGSALNGKRVLVLGDSVVLGATNDIYGMVPGVFVDAMGSRNMTDAINLLASYRASNGGNLPYIIVLGLVTNYTPFGVDTLQAIMNTAGPGHQFVFVTGYCGEYSRDAQNNVIKAVAASNGNVHVADWVPVVLSNVGGYTYADHTHLTPAGRQAYAALINGVVSGL